MPIRCLRLAAVVGMLCAAQVAAQGFPAKRITFIVPYPSGSSDQVARIYADHLKDRLGQPVVVENRPGAGGFVGTDALAKSTPDGYTIGLVGQQLSAPRSQIPASITFDQVKDFAPIGRMAGSPFVIVVPAELKASSLKEFIAYAKANPGKVNYGVVPNSTMQVDMERFNQLTDSKLTDIPFNGATPITTAILGNQVQMTFLSSTVIPHIKSGKLAALAVTQKGRWSVLPDVPSTYELGFNFDSGFWYGVVAPAGVPTPILARLAADFAEVGKKSELKEQVRRLSLDPIDPSPAEMASVLQRERAQNSGK